MDENASGSPARTPDDDEFGAWVDSADLDDFTSYEAPTSTPFIAMERSQAPQVTTVRELRRMNSLEQDTRTLGSLVVQTRSISDNTMSDGLYFNPWDDDVPSKMRSSHQTEYDDECDIDPEVDSALAFSAWESTLAQDKHSVRNDNDDEEAVFDAWDDDQRTANQEWTPADEVAQDLNTLNSGVDTRTASRDETQQRHGFASQRHSEGTGMTNDSERRPIAWMQRLT